MLTARRLSILAASLWPLLAAAQYKVVGPDGSVTYTDRPPAAANNKVTPLTRSGGPAISGAAADSGMAQLPPELRQAAARYPVLLYTTTECASCDNARQLLQQRGIPYNEKRVLSEDDAVALERGLGWRTVPSLTIGPQALRGLTTLEWNAYLDAAGYPKESKLPRNWQPPVPTALVEKAAPAPRVAAPAPAPVRAAAPTPPPEPAGDDESKPTIRF